MNLLFVSDELDVRNSCNLCFFLQQNDDTEDLIQLDSASDLDEFDPIKSLPSSQKSNNQIPLTITNPLYTYENHNVRQTSSNSNYNETCNRHDQDLLQEYGLDFSFSTIQNQSNLDTFNVSKVNSQGQWTKFE